MKRIHSSLNTVELSMLKDMMEREGIDCILKQEKLSALAGIMSKAHCMAELWLLNDERLEKAQEIIDEYLKEFSNKES
jgi:hypothetical protein